MKNSDKQTYYVITYDGTKLGLFCLYKYIISHVMYAVEHGYIPVVDLHSAKTQYFKDGREYWDNPWEYYFKQPYNISPQDMNKNNHIIFSPNTCWGDDKFKIYPALLPLSKNDSHKKNQYLDEYHKYLRFTPEIKRYLNKELKLLFGDERDILGIIVRGTDFIETKPKGHAIQPTAEQIIEKVKELQKKLHFKKIYLATEDANIYDKIKTAFGNMVIDNNQYMYKSVGGKWIADFPCDRKDHFYNLGKEYIRSIYLLSQCKYLIGGRANGTVAVWIMTNGFKTFDYVYLWDLGYYGDAPKPAPIPTPAPVIKKNPKPAAKPAPLINIVPKNPPSYRADLFGFIPLYKITTDYETTEYKILGLPIWKTKEIKDKNTGEFKTRYYLCGIPLTEVCDKYEEDNI